MNAFSVVRFLVKPGRERDFVEAHRQADTRWPGLVKGVIVKTGERAFCLVCEWHSMQDIAAARPAMIAVLDTFRDHLEDQGKGLGITDAVSGEVVFALG